MINPIKIYLDQPKEEINELQSKINFQSVSRRFYGMLIKAHRNDVSIEKFIDFCDHILEKKMIPDVKFHKQYNL